MHLHIAYSTDDNYAQHTGVSLISLYEHNQECEEISVYIIENDISTINKNLLKNIAIEYKRTVQFISLKEYMKYLKLNMEYKISINSYARLFLSSMVGEQIEKILYLDCDSIILGSLQELWETDLEGYYLAGVKDTVSKKTKTKIGLSQDDEYINAGMVLINLKAWREHQIEQQFLDFIALYNGNVFHHDQGTMNGVCKGKIKILSPKYNVMSTFFTMKRKEIDIYYDMEDYYTAKDLKDAVNNPIFVHFTPAFVNRPWIKGCKHPLKGEYEKYLKMTPWKNEALWNDKRKIGEKIVAFLYNQLPFEVANKLCNIIFS